MTDTNAISRDFEKYDQVRKSHTYRLAEGKGDDFDEEYRIATLDFGRFLQGDAKEKARFADEFTAALQDIGFAVLTGHGVDPTLYDEMHDRVAELFTSTSIEDKMRFRARRQGSVSQGYFPRRKPARSIRTLSRAGSGAGARSMSHRIAISPSAPRIIGLDPNMNRSSAGWSKPTSRSSSLSRRPFSRVSAAIRTFTTES